MKFIIEIEFEPNGPRNWDPPYLNGKKNYLPFDEERDLDEIIDEITESVSQGLGEYYDDSLYTCIKSVKKAKA